MEIPGVLSSLTAKSQQFWATSAVCFPPEIQLPLVSIIVTAYNCEQFIRRTLESVAALTYPIFECIISEDAATDGTVGVIEEFLADQRDSRFRLIRSDANRGQLSAQMSGFSASCGEFVVFLDADDLLNRDAIEAHLSVHLGCEPIVAMTCLDSAMVDENGVLLSAHHREIRRRFWKWFRPALLERNVQILGDSTEVVIVPPSIANRITLGDQYFWTTQSFMMFRRDFLTLVLPEETQRFRVCSDFYLVRMAHAFSTTALVLRIGGAYRIHGNNHFSHRTLVSADQESSDGMRFAWQRVELAALAAPVLKTRYERFAAVFGDIRVMRAILSLPRKVRPPVFRLIRLRMSFVQACFFLTIAKASCTVGKLRASWNTFLRIVWAGS